MASSIGRPRSTCRWDTRLQHREKFTTCIRNNIRDYGSASTCLKELLANADDAKATHLTVCLDKSCYTTDGLLCEGMAVLQGLALWICNDAEFSQDNWTSYTLNVGESAKAKDTETTGKFGKGALTAYSLADVIQVLSGDHLLTLDPHGTHLPDKLESIFGNLVSPQDEHFVDVAHGCPGQLEPFLAFTKQCPSVPTLALKDSYPGTLFRLALRTRAAAEASKISSNSFTAEQFVSTLHTFLQAAPDLLLFTRHVKRISVYMKEDVHTPCALLHECAATTSSLPSAIQTCQLQQLSISLQHADSSKSNKTWLKSVHSSAVGRPEGGVAVLLNEGPAAAANTLPAIAGKVYSTMALPLEGTCLPVHINGAFLVSADRRSIWTGEGDGGQGAENIRVLAEDIAPSYAAAIASSCSGSDATKVYRLWPTAHSFQPRLLDSVTAATVKSMVSQGSKVLWVPALKQSAGSGNPGKWVNTAEACFLPSHGAVPEEVVDVARRAGLLVPELPDHAFQAIKAAAERNNVQLTCLSASNMRRALRSKGNIVKPSEISAVLSYVISDDRFEDLHDLHLILLSDNTIKHIKWNSPRSSKYFVFTDAKSRSIFDLMAANKHQLVEHAPAWAAIAKAKHRGVPLLESKSLNVLVPTIQDLANSLPSAWKSNICDRSGDSSRCHPSRKWLNDFWTFMSRSMSAVPAELHSFVLVPITGNRLASVAHCRDTQALSFSQLGSWSSTAAAALSAVGCLCIAEARADSVVPDLAGTEPITAAVDNLSSRTGMPLQQLVAPGRLGHATFQEARKLLANHVHAPRGKSANVWQILKQCPVFEVDRGDTAAECHCLPSGQLGLLPDATWEAHMAELGQLLPWLPVKYHTASETQRQLLKHSGMKTPSMSDFLRYSLVPAIKDNSTTNSAEPLLLLALDELALHANQTLSPLSNIFVTGRLHPISRCVDSTSALFRSLFSQPSASGYTLLPDVYATPQRLAVLKQHGLAHEDSPDPAFFLECAKRFSELSSSQSRSRDDIKRLSWSLVNMLHANIAAYLRGYAWNQISDCAVFKKAELQFPYKSSNSSSSSSSSQQVFVSLADSADHDHYRLVALAVPVTDNVHGDTKTLRARLGLPSEPVLEHVVDHMLKMTASGHFGALSKQMSNPLSEILLEDIKQSYIFIVASIGQKLAVGQGSDAVLGKTTERLGQEPWVLVQGSKFVVPSELCYDLEEDTHHGYQVPSMLLRLLNKQPAVKQWFRDKLKVTDLRDGAPSVRQLHDNPVTASTSVAKYLEGDFNNPAAYPDAIILVKGQEIHVHRQVVAKACKVLARRWDPVWSASHTSFAMDESLCCEACSIYPSHGTALLFLEYFYTGDVNWPGGQAEVGCALELLVMACMYDVQHLVCIAEKALQDKLTPEICCSILAVADHHEAVQLRECCMHLIKKLYKTIRQSEEYKALSIELQTEVQQGV